MVSWLLNEGHLIVRIAGAAILSFLLVALLAPRTIRYLVRSKLGDRPEFDHADLNQLTRHKSNTPTMGGALVVVAILLSVLMFGNLNRMYVKMALFGLVWLGVLGGVDDWLKLRRAAGQTSRDGLKSWEKLLFQIVCAMLLAFFTWKYGKHSTPEGGTVNPAHSLYIPFLTGPITLGLLVYVIIAVVTMVGSSNAVNLTDGMDGLAAGCMTIVCGVFLLLSWVVGVAEWANLFHMPVVAGAAEMTVVCAAMLGACMGFLWYNAHPAQVFMGDTGSLPLGGLIGYIAVVTRQEFVLLLAGGVFVIEAGSVMLQVGYFKFTKPAGGGQGKRLFRCAPLHHHFHLGGWAESKVVIRFWILGVLFGALSLATLKLYQAIQR